MDKLFDFSFVDPPPNFQQWHLLPKAALGRGNKADETLGRKIRVQDHPERKRVPSLKVLETESRFLKEDLIKIIYYY